MACSLLLACAAPAAAQDQGRAGLTMWYPVGFGVLFQVSGHVALRPDIGMTREVNEGVIENTLNTWRVGLSALFYLQKRGNLRTYVSPRITCGRSTERWHQYSEGERVTDSCEASGSLGAQYAMVRRFSVFGEVGLAYTDRHVTESNGWFFRKSETWELRTVVGVILFF